VLLLWQLFVLLSGVGSLILFGPGDTLCKDQKFQPLPPDKINKSVRFGSASQQMVIGKRGRFLEHLSLSHMKANADVLGDYTRALTTTDQFFWSKEAAELHCIALISHSHLSQPINRAPPVLRACCKATMCVWSQLCITRTES
jgi:hypothetical protein